MNTLLLKIIITIILLITCCRSFTFNAKNDAIPLFFSIENNDLKEVEYLLLNNNYEDSVLFKGLLKSIRFKDLNLVKLFLSQNLDIEQETLSKVNPFNLAININSLVIFNHLLEYYFNENPHLDISSERAFDFLLKQPFNWQLYLTNDDLNKTVKNNLIYSLAFLNNINFDINYKNRDNLSPILIASKRGFPKILNYLINNGANIEDKDQDLLTPLRYAVMFNHLECTSILIKNNANINTRDRFGWTPLLSSVSNNNEYLTELLLKSGADPNIKTRNGHPPIVQAIQNNNFNITKLLIRYEANINNPEVTNNNSPIYLSVKQGNKEITQLLLENGADVNSRGRIFNDTILMKASGKQLDSIVNLLISFNANINLQDRDGHTALSYAMERNHFSTIELLLENGADLNIRDSRNRTVIEAWEWRLDPEIADYISKIN